MIVAGGLLTIVRHFERIEPGRKVFDSEDLRIMQAAYDGALRALQVRNRFDPITEDIAIMIIDLVERGERDPKRLLQHAVRAFRISDCGK